MKGCWDYFPPNRHSHPPEVEHFHKVSGKADKDCQPSSPRGNGSYRQFRFHRHLPRPALSRRNSASTSKGVRTHNAFAQLSDVFFLQRGMRQRSSADVAQGLTNREISSKLNLSAHTVKNHLFRIFEKLGISSRVELVLYALDQREPQPSPAAKGFARVTGHNSRAAISRRRRQPRPCLHLNTPSASP